MEGELLHGLDHSYAASSIYSKAVRHLKTDHTYAFPADIKAEITYSEVQGYPKTDHTYTFNVDIEAEIAYSEAEGHPKTDHTYASSVETTYSEAEVPHSTEKLSPSLANIEVEISCAEVEAEVHHSTENLSHFEVEISCAEAETKQPITEMEADSSLKEKLLEELTNTRKRKLEL